MQLPIQLYPLCLIENVKLELFINLRLEYALMFFISSERLEFQSIATIQ